MTRRPLRLLILGGTGEAARLAARLAGAEDLAVISSLAGRTTRPRLPDGIVPTGGFGGAAGLAAYLRQEHVDVVVDATHPFATRITAAAVTACQEQAVPLLALRRPPWQPQAGDEWHEVDSLASAAAGLSHRGQRVFLAVGRHEVAPFAPLAGCWFLVRAIEPPVEPLPRAHELVLARGPFTLNAELALLREHQIDVVVSKNSGGTATYAKIAAARHLRLPVVMVRRPPLAGSPTVATVAAAAAWVRQHARRLQDGGRSG